MFTSKSSADEFLEMRHIKGQLGAARESFISQSLNQDEEIDNAKKLRQAPGKEKKKKIKIFKSCDKN